MRHHVVVFSALAWVASFTLAGAAQAVDSAELYSGASYRYGRFEARLRFAAGDGVVSSFFLWKDGSETTGTFWNELDFEKVGADCHLETNALFGKPAASHNKKQAFDFDLCSDFHTYAYEWTPESIAWLVDGAEIRREVGPTASAFADNAAAGMQIRFNIWPGDASFGGNFSPAILPVRQYVDWVQYSSYADGAFTLEWRDDFDAPPLSSNWLTATWASPKSLSTHSPANVAVNEGALVLSLTGDATAATGGSGGSSSAPGGSGGSSSAPGGTASAGAAGFDNGYTPGSGCMLRAPTSSGASRAALMLAALVLGRRSWKRRPVKRPQP